VRFDSAGNFESFEPFLHGFLRRLRGKALGYFGRPVGLAW
jgi:hypothetical protein